MTDNVSSETLNPTIPWAVHVRKIPWCIVFASCFSSSGDTGDRGSFPAENSLSYWYLAQLAKLSVTSGRLWTIECQSTTVQCIFLPLLQLWAGHRSNLCILCWGLKLTVMCLSSRFITEHSNQAGHWSAYVEVCISVLYVQILPDLISVWPHLRCDVGLDEWKY